MSPRQLTPKQPSGSDGGERKACDRSVLSTERTLTVCAANHTTQQEHLQGARLGQEPGDSAQGVACRAQGGLGGGGSTRLCEQGGSHQGHRAVGLTGEGWRSFLRAAFSLSCDSCGDALCASV